MMKYISVAIDGPSGAGKSTVARAAAAKLGYVYVDTGAMYRSIGLAVCRRGIAGEDTTGIIATLPEIAIQLTYQDGAQHVLLNGMDGILHDINERDRQDMTRAVAPLKQADDAVLLDTSSLTLEESIAAVLRIIREKTEEKA